MIPSIAYIGSPAHWFILFIIVLIVFGAKRLPDIARNLGKGLAEFKKARREFEKELNSKDDSSTSDKNESDK